jgi:hypothetical protein
LIDAALIYAMTEWIAPPVVSAVIYLGLSDIGQALLVLIVYVVLMAIAVVRVIKMGPLVPDTPDEKGELVYVWGPRPMPYMPGGGGRWIRVRATD